MAVTATTRRLTNELRTELLRVTDTHTADMIAAWARAWDEIAPDLRDTLADLLRVEAGHEVSHATFLRNARLRRALATVADQLERLTRDAGVTVTGDLHDLCERAGQAQAAIIASQLPAGQDLVDLDAWSRADERQLDAIVRRTTEQITSQLRPLSDEAYAVVQRELVRGVAAGSTPDATARRMIRRAEGGFNGGLSRAMTITRTETLDAYRAASAVGQKPHREVLGGWQWLASLSSRTCPACLSMNGRTFALSEPGPQGHQNCRCARLPVTRSWADLGFEDVDEPESVVPSSEAFFAGLSRSDQVGMLGARGFEAWSAGRWPMDEWAVKRSTRGWRDSWVVATPPK